MQKLVSMVLFGVCIVGGSLWAQDKGSGLGLIVGEPTGISGKFWNGATTAFDLALAWSLRNDDRVVIHGDYLWHDFSLISIRRGKLPIYYGIGAVLGLNDDVTLGLRVPIGITYLFPKAPVDIFFELSPGLRLVPATRFRIGAALGARYYWD